MTRAQKFTLGVLSVIACVVWLAVFYFVPLTPIEVT